MPPGSCGCVRPGGLGGWAAAVLLVLCPQGEETGLLPGARGGSPGQELSGLRLATAVPVGVAGTVLRPLAPRWSLRSEALCRSALGSLC